MLFEGSHGKSLVSEEFNKLCIDNHVQVSVTSLQNPGDPMRSMRVFVFKNFNPYILRVVQFNKKQQIHLIPAKGELTIMLHPDELLPHIEREE